MYVCCWCCIICRTLSHVQMQCLNFGVAAFFRLNLWIVFGNQHCTAFHTKQSLTVPVIVAVSSNDYILTRLALLLLLSSLYSSQTSAQLCWICGPLPKTGKRTRLFFSSASGGALQRRDEGFMYHQHQIFGA